MVRDVVRASVSGLEKVDRARKNKKWNKHATAWCEEAFVTEPTLRRFWARVKILRESFDHICRAVNLNPEDIYEQEENVNSLPEMELAVLDEEWVGRENILTDLVEKLENQHRIVLILGITGIGKTALAESLVIKLRGNWHERRENFENVNLNKNFVTVVTGWLNNWGDRVTPEEQNNPEQLLTRVVDRLCKGKYLLLLDSLEYLLVATSDDSWGNFEDEWWGKLWIGILSAPSCQSRIILTSQDFPVQLAIECGRYTNFWHQQLLTGLGESEQKELFTKLGFAEEIKSRDRRLLLIGNIYDGHPLALRVIVGEIKTGWQSNIRAYWQENGRYIEEVQTDLQAARAGEYEGSNDRWQLAAYTIQLRRYVKNRIDLTFNRLKEQIPIAYELICIASIYRCEVPESFWLGNLELEGYDLEEQQIALTTLRDRYLVEECGFNEADERMVSQHNLIRSVAIDRRLILAQEKDSHA
jgi:hypothetical protein